MKKIYLILCILFCACSNSSKIDLQINNKVILPKIYNVKKSSSVIVIDGIADEASWKVVEQHSSFLKVIPKDELLAYEETNKKRKF